MGPHPIRNTHSDCFTHAFDMQILYNELKVVFDEHGTWLGTGVSVYVQFPSLLHS